MCMLAMAFGVMVRPGLSPLSGWGPLSYLQDCDLHRHLLPRNPSGNRVPLGPHYACSCTLGGVWAAQAQDSPPVPLRLGHRPHHCTLLLQPLDSLSQPSQQVHVLGFSDLWEVHWEGAGPSWHESTSAHPRPPSTLSCPLGAPFTLDSQILHPRPTEPRASFCCGHSAPAAHLNLPPLPEIGVLIPQTPHPPHPCSWPPPLPSIAFPEGSSALGPEVRGHAHIRLWPQG